MKPRHAFWKLWGWPIVFGILTGVGLVSALFSDGGLGDVLAWLTLGIPVAACVWFGFRPNRRRCLSSASGFRASG